MKLSPSDLDQCFQLFEEEGYFILPQFFERADIAGLQERIDQIMLGTAGCGLRSDLDAARYCFWEVRRPELGRQWLSESHSGLSKDSGFRSRSTLP